MSNSPASRNVALFTLGGTIAMTSDGSKSGVTPTLSARQLLAAVPGLADSGVTVDVVDFRSKSGASLALSDITDLAAEIRQFVPRSDGVVVTQGTDTIEETAFLLDLLHSGPNPVVVTGAMRNPTLAGADGPGNILAAVQTAAHPDMSGQGCVVVFNDEIHAARRVRKTHSSSTAAFVSPNGGPLGYITENRPYLCNRLGYRTILPKSARQATAQIPLVTATLGDDDSLVRAAASHANGLVVAGFGAGHVPGEYVSALTELAARIPVVLASRTGAGTVFERTYGFSGSERDLLARGIIRAGYLDPLKARILLQALVAIGADRETIATAFSVAGGYNQPENWPWPVDHHEDTPADARP